MDIDSSYNFEDKYNEVDSSISVSQWLKYENSGGFYLNSIESILLAGKLMITIMITVSSFQLKSSLTSSALSLSLSEEVIERILSVSTSFINNNALIQGNFFFFLLLIYIFLYNKIYRYWSKEIYSTIII
jgi:hypothetical protein